MNQSQNIQASHSNIKNFLPCPPLSKAFAHEDFSTKALGSDPELARWYEDNIPYWRSVQSGKVQVSPQEYQELQQWFGYAEQQLGIQSSSWGNDAGAMPGAELQGAQKGPAGNLNVTDPSKSEFTADGSTPVVDVWVDSTVNIPPPCTGTAETTTDTRHNPPETLTKIVVTNPSVRDAHGNPAQTVIFVHDGGKVTANATSKGDGTPRFVDSTGTVTVGQYTGSHAKGGAQGITDRVPVKNSEGTLAYVGNGPDDVIDFDFSKRANGVAGETYDVQAGSSFTFKNDDQVQIEKAPNGSDYSYVLTVTHSDREQDVFHLHGEAPYTSDLNAIPSHLHFKTGSGLVSPTEQDNNGSTQGVLPEGFAGYFHINGNDSVTDPNSTIFAQANERASIVVNTQE